MYICVRTADDDFLVIYLCQRVCSIRQRAAIA